MENPFLDVDPIDEAEGEPTDGNAIGTGYGSIRVPLQRFSNWYTYSTDQDIQLSSYL